MAHVTETISAEVISVYYFCDAECEEKFLKGLDSSEVVTEQYNFQYIDNCTNCEECGERMECDSQCDEDDCEGREFWAEQNDHARAYYYG